MSDKASESEDEETQTKREKLIDLIRKIAIKKPEKVIAVPEGLRGFGQVTALQSICIGCHKCEEVCKLGAPLIENKFDLPSLFEDNITKDIKSENRRLLIDFIKKIAVKKPEEAISLPSPLRGFGSLCVAIKKCITCGDCEETCPEKVIEIKPIFDLSLVFQE
ncbi:MAG: 4Fe-4S dicluster domain-containing protein [Candidatus Lokiarchaeota archaeon]|nr:4Fe-4S dicluster domain-containing protein [Candidatus Lokiarchaeota archaeon]